MVQISKASESAQICLVHQKSFPFFRPQPNNQIKRTESNNLNVWEKLNYIDCNRRQLLKPSLCAHTWLNK
jgi:hypothetical protein